jgi:hypothetical protein
MSKKTKYSMMAQNGQYELRSTDRIPVGYIKEISVAANIYSSLLNFIYLKKITDGKFIYHKYGKLIKEDGNYLIFEAVDAQNILTNNEKEDVEKLKGSLVRITRNNK